MNRDGGGNPGRRASRQITAEEAELWRRLSQSVEKVKTKPRVAAHGENGAGPDSVPPQSPRRAAAPQATQPQVLPSQIPPPSAPAPRRAPLPSELDRRTVRQVAAGKASIDAVLDLHGLHQDTAYGRLRAFLVSAQAKGHRMVLVITGKGAGAGRDDAGLSGTDPRGVLRRSVPLWLEDPELRAVVLGYAPAGVRHGGEGALYIRLRKAREA